MYAGGSARNGVLAASVEIGLNALANEWWNRASPGSGWIDEKAFPGVLDAGLLNDPVVALRAAVGIVRWAAPEADRLIEGVELLAQELDALRSAVRHVASAIVEPDVDLGTEEVLPLELDEVVEELGGRLGIGTGHSRLLLAAATARI